MSHRYYPFSRSDLEVSLGLVISLVQFAVRHSHLRLPMDRKQLVTLSDSQEAQRGLARKARAEIQPKVNFNSGASESSTPVLRWKWQWIWKRCHIWSQRSNGDDLTNASPLELWEFQQRLWTCNRGPAKWWKCVSPSIASRVKEIKNWVWTPWVSFWSNCKHKKPLQNTFCM